MRRRRIRIACLMAGLLLLQWGSALLPHIQAMTSLAAAQRVTICTHDGTRDVLLDEDGRPVEQIRVADCCTLCQWPQATEPPAAQQPAIPMRPVIVAEPYGRPGFPVAPPRAPPQQPRAPPRA
jgi:hypothetical protein